uniref:Putative secreted protein n=1 Tax=Anopheles marajoara TaxID=58244 RepID=A0A2M4CE70_9DIPT
MTLALPAVFVLLLTESACCCCCCCCLRRRCFDLCVVHSRSRISRPQRHMLRKTPASMSVVPRHPYSSKST